MVDVPPRKTAAEREMNGAYQDRSGLVNRTTSRSGGCNNRLSRLLLLELKPVKRGITPAPAQEVVVPPRLDGTAVLHDENAIGVRHRMKSVGNRKCRSSLAKSFHCFANLKFRFGIERGRRLVQQNYRSILD